MAISVKLQVFEGPLDLLLHLIEKNKIDIYDIPIVEITEQYIGYLRNLQEFDIIMAALKEGGYHAKWRPDGRYIISCIKNSYDNYSF